MCRFKTSQTSAVAFIILLFLIFPILLIVSCSRDSKTDFPNSPSAFVSSDIPESPQSNRFLLGYWDAFIPESHDSMEIVPRRSNSIHLNIRRLLEIAPCNDCFKLVDLNIDQPNQILSATLRITHPFPGLNQYTVFDVRLVIISDGTLGFPTLDATIPWIDNGDFTILNQDGYTRFWNTVEFGEGTGAFAILEYSQGNLAFPGEFTGTVNPFVSFGTDPRNHFGTTESLDRTVEFKLVPGSIRFGYAIDASWDLPTVIPPENIETDFPVSANALESTVVSYNVFDDLEDTQGSAGEIGFHVFDYQGADTIESASLECPDIWNGAVDAASIQYSTATDAEIFFNITNENGASIGNYTALLVVRDESGDFWLGDVNHAYSVIDLPVVEDISPQVTGEIVYVAPGPPDPQGFPGAANVWHMDLETGVETQLTNFFGVGYLFHEPRMNPAGTHHLHCAGPTPYYSNVRVYEFGGSDWTISTDEVDNWADFHPDGIHIVTASGSEWSDTPDLYMMEYDGSNRVKIATAPDTILNIAVSPDGKYIALTLGIDYADPPSCELWLYDIDLGEFSEIMPAPGVDRNPGWSPVKVDGEYLLVYASSRDHYPNYETDLYVVNPFTEEIICHYDTGTYEGHPSFSPDGLSFIYEAQFGVGDDSELFIYSWKTEELMQITDDDTYDGSPYWCWGM